MKVSQNILFFIKGCLKRSFSVFFFVIVLITFLGFASPVFSIQVTAQTTSGETLNKEEWEKIRKNKSYIENYKEFKKRDKKNREIKPRSWNGLFGGGLARLLVWGIIIAVLVFALIAILRHFSGSNVAVNTRVKGRIQYSFDDVEENIHEYDLEKMLKDFLAKEEFKAAVRIYYLIIIRELSTHKIIEWEKDKTNGDYLYEIKEKPFYNEVKLATKYYEWAWFSHYPVGSMEYEQISTEYKKLLDTIQKA